MQRSSITKLSSAFTALIIIVFGSYVIAAQTEISGTWTARESQKSPGKLQIGFERTQGVRGQNHHSSSFDLEDLRGISRSQIVNGRVAFSIVREAGTIECTGDFVDGRGSGTYRFIPNYGFADGLRARGFDVDSQGRGSQSIEERLFAAAALDVKMALADDLVSANFGKLTMGDLFKATIFKIDGRFMAEMKATGFPNLSMEDLVKARIFKIDAEFVRMVKDMGFGADNFENLVKYSIFKVTPEFLSELRNEGLTDLRPEDVVKLRIFKIDAAFVRQARSEDPNATVQDIVNKKLGVWVKLK